MAVHGASRSLACVWMVQSHAHLDEHCIEAREDDFIGSDEGTPRSGGLMRKRQEFGAHLPGFARQHMMTRRMTV